MWRTVDYTGKEQIWYEGELVKKVYEICYKEVNGTFIIEPAEVKHYRNYSKIISILEEFEG